MVEKEAHHALRYCVRPNSGRVEPGHEVEVTGPSQPDPYPLANAGLPRTWGLIAAQSFYKR